MPDAYLIHAELVAGNGYNNPIAYRAARALWARRVLRSGYVAELCGETNLCLLRFIVPNCLIKQLRQSAVLVILELLG